MTTARSSQVDLDATSYYHLTARCVRRSFLCGEDELTQKNFNHRKLWLIERLRFLATIFSIDVCAYAIMSNHFHLILRVLAEAVAKWSDKEVIGRVRRLCPGCVENIENWAEEERQKVLTIWRERLCSMSWFMAKLNEYIARKANKEDGCKGRFWEGRFCSQALLDEGALLACMSYVDLNPIRAGIAQGLDDSSWASIRQRIEEESLAVRGADSTTELPKEPPAPPTGPGLDSCPRLAPLEGGPQRRGEPLPFTLPQYLELLEWTGRTIREDKKGHITGAPSKLLEQFGLDPAHWRESVERFSSLGVFVGHPKRLEQQAAQLGQRWLKGQTRAAQTYGKAA